MRYRSRHDGMSNSQLLRVGFVGLRDIGGPMAARCIDAGFPVTLWARRAAALSRYREGSYRWAESPAGVGRNSDVVAVAVFNEDDAREVVAGEVGIAAGMGAGGIILVHSTVSIGFMEDPAEGVRRTRPHPARCTSQAASGLEL